MTHKPGDRVWIRLRKWEVVSVSSPYVQIRPVGGTAAQTVSVHQESLPRPRKARSRYGCAGVREHGRMVV